MNVRKHYFCMHLLQLLSPPGSLVYGGVEPGSHREWFLDPEATHVPLAVLWYNNRLLGMIPYMTGTCLCTLL